MTRIYTKSGDDGTTSLFSGTRVQKTHPQVEAYGTIDELNAAVGFTVVQTQQPNPNDKLRQISEMLIAIQQWLFDAGAVLASPPPPAKTQPIKAATVLRAVDLDWDHKKCNDAIAQIEGWIDLIDDSLAPLKNFILPGGCEAAARLHLARTICRRAERRVQGAIDSQNGAGAGAGIESKDGYLIVLRFLNRVGDLFFVLARCLNVLYGEDDVVWDNASS